MLNLKVNFFEKKRAQPHTATPYVNAECRIMNAEFNRGDSGRKKQSLVHIVQHCFDLH